MFSGKDTEKSNFQRPKQIGSHFSSVKEVWRQDVADVGSMAQHFQDPWLWNFLGLFILNVTSWPQDNCCIQGRKGVCS